METRVFLTFAHSSSLIFSGCCCLFCSTFWSLSNLLAEEITVWWFHPTLIVLGDELYNLESALFIKLDRLFVRRMDM